MRWQSVSVVCGHCRVQIERAESVQCPTATPHESNTASLFLAPHPTPSLAPHPTPPHPTRPDPVSYAPPRPCFTCVAKSVDLARRTHRSPLSSLPRASPPV